VTPGNDKLIRRIVGTVAALALLWLTVHATWYFARLPESNCTMHSVLEVRSAEPPYRAVLTEKNCNVGETRFYSLTMDTRAGVVRNLPLESDMMHPPRPTLRWTDPRTLDVSVPTNAISGAITEHWADGFTLARTFVPGAKEQ